ncbi:MAG: hypothetical protein KC736_03035 [Candidatus Moranbacteria bacterium]|nr:hypothetical protein [Candidatus Moranbacteria bacterium]
MGINLSRQQNFGGQQASGSRGSLMKTGPISVVILIIVAIAWGGVFFYESTLKKELATTNKNIETETQNLDQETLNRVADFQERIRASKDHLSNLEQPQETMIKIQGKILPQTVLSRYAYIEQEGKNMIELEGVVENFDVLAKQIAALKEINEVSVVKTDKVERDEEGNIVAILNIFI